MYKQLCLSPGQVSSRQLSRIHEELYENKGAAICLRYNIVSTNHMLPKLKIFKHVAIFGGCTARFVSDLAVTLKYTFCRGAAQIKLVTHLSSDMVICFTGEAHLLATVDGTDWVLVTHLSSDMVICFTGEAHLLATVDGTDWVLVTHLSSDMVICFTGEAHLLATVAGTDWVRVPGVFLELDGAGDGLLSRFIASKAGDSLRLIPGTGDALRRVFVGPEFETVLTERGEFVD